MKHLSLPLAAAVAASAAQPDVNKILSQMTVKQKIGQMTQLDLSVLIQSGSVYTLDPLKLQTIIGEYGVGSILNSARGCQCDSQSCISGTSLTGWRNITTTLAAFTLQSQPNIQPPIPLLYGTDSVHGANWLDEGVWFQHNFGLASMWRPDLVTQAATVATLDTRSMGASWQFAPVMGLGMEPKWSRFYETPGESPFVGATQGAAYMQGVAAASAQLGLNYSLAVPTIKHYFGYSAPRTGKDRTDAWIPDAYLKQYFQPSFEAALRSNPLLPGVGLGGSVMVNSASVNGIPATASKALLTDILRTEIGCVDCVALTDWQDIEKVFMYHNMASNMGEAIQLALDAGIDMSMVPYDLSFPDVLYSMVTNGTIPVSRLDESVLRILKLKVAMGLFDAPAVPAALASRAAWNPQDDNLALTIARESLTLLANNVSSATGGKPALPLSGWLPAGAKVLVIGPAGLDIISLCGGWTLPYIGPVTNGQCGSAQTRGSGIGPAVAALAGQYGVNNVVVMQGVDYSAMPTPAQLANATLAAQAADVVILAIGEKPETETGGDTQDLTMSLPQLLLFNAVQVAGKPIISVLVEPRPRILSNGQTDIAGGSHAILMAYLPCYTGGQAIAEVLFGAVNPSGKLAFTYPRTSGDLDVHWHKPWNGSLVWEGQPDSTYHNPLFPFGHGLSYSTLTYSNLQLSSYSVRAGEAVAVSVDVSNAGPWNASEAALFFARQLYRASITPEFTNLVGFIKLPIPVGQMVTAQIMLNTSVLAYWSPSLVKSIDAGVYNVSVGGLTAQLTLTTPAQAVFTGQPGAWQWEEVRVDDASSRAAAAVQQSESDRPLPDDDLLAAIVAEGLLDNTPVARSIKEDRLRQLLLRNKRSRRVAP